ncbi:flagellar basal body L-ring protein FlgH [Steroidobacter flavus]|uniref:Flagellar basal body L-ring protein FlgH n=1 Tax=Steroidobacter flavus TaxID=1842136 RepID=A0ABV8SZ01_9GAMM
MSANKFKLACLMVGTASLAAAPTLAQQAEAPLLQRSLFADRKAFRAGDMLTVVVTEAASASASARTSADKQESVFGQINQPDERPWNIDLAFGNDFDGGGQIQRTGKLLAKLAVVVQGVDAHGNLSVIGEQEIRVNNEEQRIALSGTVRPEDIGPDNTIASWRIANARIDFKGEGVLARKQSPGLLTKLFDLFGLN